MRNLHFISSSVMPDTDPASPDIRIDNLALASSLRSGDADGGRGRPKSKIDLPDLFRHLLNSSVSASFKKDPGINPGMLKLFGRPRAMK